MSSLSFQQLTSVYDTIESPLLILDENNHKVLYLNPAAQDVSGYCHTDDEDLTIQQLMHKSSHQKVEALLDILNGKNKSVIKEPELKIRRKSGRSIICNITAQKTPLLDRDTVLLSIHDVTEIKELHAKQANALVQLAHLSKLADIGCLASGVAHEINNPLAVIRLCAETLELLVENGQIDQKVFSRQLGIAITSVDRIIKIIKQMRSLVRNENLKVATVEIKETLFDILKLYGQKMTARHIQLEANHSFEGKIDCDEQQIEQVLINLINNSIQSLQNLEGERRMRVSIYEKLENIVIDIWDNGQPIPAEIQDKIFTPFFTAKPVGTGTGMGLPIAYNIIKSHGGELTFFSNSEDGTQFRITLPKTSSLAGTAA